MKVIVIIDSIDLYGKERANIQVARVLKKYGCDIMVLLNERADEIVRAEVNDFNVVTMPFPRNIKGKWRYWSYVKNYFNTLIQFRNLIKQEKPDYILIPTEIALSYLYLALAGTKAKVVFRCGDSPLTYRKSGTILCRLYVPLWKHIILKRVDKLVCNSKFILNQMKESGRVDKGYDKLIYNFPPHRRNTEDNQIPYEGMCPFSIKIGFLGRIVPEKGILELVNAVIETNKMGYVVELLIGGDTNIDNDYTMKINTAIDCNREYKERIHFIGVVNDVAQFYSSVDFVSVPSIYEEPSPNVVVEAKMCHKLSLVFSRGGIPELVEHLKTGYICDRVSSEALSEGIEYYCNNREEIKRQGENAYLSIKELGMTEAVFERKWLEVIN